MLTRGFFVGYAGACHAGAAIEALCYSEGEVDSSSNSYQFWFDYSTYDSETGEVQQPGWVSWKLQTGDGQELLEPLSFTPASLASNVLPGLFTPSETDYESVGFDADNALYMTGGIDDSSFNATRPEPAPFLESLYQWHLCYQSVGGYYYQSIAWVLTEPPHNPSCEPVNLTFEKVEA